MIERIGNLNAVLLKRSRTRSVYFVEEAPAGRAAVLKLYDSGAEAVRECEALDACSGDPHVPHVLDFFQTQGKWCLLTEYVSGETLDVLVGRTGPLPPAKVIDVAVDILAGISAVHRSGYVHADVHDRNVIVTDFDRSRTKIVDFQHASKILRSGTAHSIRSVDARRPVLAPELATGVIDQRFDIYGAGYICAFLLLGASPLDPNATLNTGASAGHPIWNVVHKAMHPDPAMRYNSAGEMTRALERL